MVSKKLFNNQIIAFVLAFMLFFVSSFTSFASSTEVGGDLEESYGRATFEYEGKYYEYQRGNVIESGETRILYSEPVYIVHVYCKELQRFYFVTAYQKSYTLYRFRNGQFVTNFTAPFVDTANCYNVVSYGSDYYTSSYPYYEFDTDEECTAFRSHFLGYVGSDYFVPINDMVGVSTSNLRFDNNFALKNAKARVENGVVIATWDVPDELPYRYSDMPLFVNMRITDLDSGVSAFYTYPSKSSLPDTNLITFYDVSHKELKFSLSDVQGLPTRFKVDFIALEPYYRIPLLELDGHVLYKGQQSLIYLNYSGVFNGLAEYGAQQSGSVQLQPDESVPITTPEDSNWDILTSIKNFFGGFFINLGSMLKDLFIPTKDQIQGLFADMESFFADRLGFLWFPFDLAITIVETFTYGDMATTFSVPPININILGGLELYSGGEFAIDQIGIFPYVRMVTSIALSCGVASLAYNKWDEWIGGHTE